MEILLTNDDGYQAKGLQTLIKLMRPFGKVTVVAPDGPRSGQSNALTATAPIRLRLLEEAENLRIFITNGTPTDCVKLALNEIFTEKKPDLLVSGINHGSNAAINVIYSGTMGAVFEGCVNGILSIGYSLCDHSQNADFSTFEPYITSITKQMLAQGLPYGTCLNVNAPKGTIKGIKTARQCEGHWAKEFDKRIDPTGKPYYWMTGYFHNHEPEATDTDEWALANGYISVVPTKMDMTDYTMLDKLDLQF